MPRIPISKTDAKPTRLGRSITNTKQAACLATIGLPLKDNEGIYIHYDEENPRKSGGVAHFNFKPEVADEMQRLIGLYDAGDADVEFDALVDDLLANGDTETKRTALILQRAYTNSLMVWGRKFLENYIRLIQFLKSEAGECVLTGGEPVYDDEGSLVGKQGCQIHFMPRKK